MKVFQKQKDKDFVILNLSDPQMSDGEWAVGHPFRAIIEHTVDELVKRTHPDLITITGDVAWADNYHSYECLARLLDSTRIPWAPVWGNHDHQCGMWHINKAAELLKSHPYCLFEDGDPAFGSGNYILGVKEGDSPIAALFMVDSHNSTEVDDGNGGKKWAYDKLWPDQQAWIKDTAISLKEEGYNDGILMLHIPLYCYKLAALGVWPDGRGGDADCGVQHEPVFSYPAEDGSLTCIKDGGLITHVLAGHDHSNNFMIDYENIHLMFAAKSGAGCYWQEKLNGGTVITISNNGVEKAYHEFVDVSHLTEGKNIHEFSFDWDK